MTSSSRQCAATPSGWLWSTLDRSVTYHELGARSAAIAARLRHLVGDAPRGPVAICLPRSIDTTIAILGVLRAGYAYVPLDPGYPAQRLAFICQDADIAAVVTRSDLRDVLARPDLPTILLDQYLPEGHLSEPEPADLAGIDRPGRAEQCAFMIYTSGSTGRPKGVRVSHRNVVNLFHSLRERPGMDQTDVLLAVSSPSFDISVLEMLLPLTVGARAVVAEREDVTDGRRLAALLDEHRATIMQATPATWHLMVAERLAGPARPAGDDRRRGAATRSRRGAAGGVRRGLEPVRTDRDDDLLHPAAGHPGRPVDRSGLHRQGRRQHHDLRPRPRPEPGAVQRRGRALDRRGRAGDRIPPAAGPHRRQLHRGALPAGAPDLPQWRPRAHAPRRQARLRRPARLPGEGPWLPGRAGRARSGAHLPPADRQGGRGGRRRRRARDLDRRLRRAESTMERRSARPS